MEYTEQQKESFKQQFAVKRKRQLITAVPLVAFFALFGFFADKDGSMPGVPASVIVPVFMVAVAGLVIFTLWNWRCPACGGYFGKGFRIRFCAKCGVPLE